MSLRQQGTQTAMNINTNIEVIRTQFIVPPKAIMI